MNKDKLRTLLVCLQRVKTSGDSSICQQLWHMDEYENMVSEADEYMADSFEDFGLDRAYPIKPPEGLEIEPGGPWLTSERLFWGTHDKWEGDQGRQRRSLLSRLIAKAESEINDPL